MSGGAKDITMSSNGRIMIVLQTDVANDLGAIYKSENYGATGSWNETGNELLGRSYGKVDITNDGSIIAISNGGGGVLIYKA